MAGHGKTSNHDGDRQGWGRAKGPARRREPRHADMPQNMPHAKTLILLMLRHVRHVAACLGPSLLPSLSSFLSPRKETSLQTQVRKHAATCRVARSRLCLRGDLHEPVDGSLGAWVGFHQVASGTQHGQVRDAHRLVSVRRPPDDDELTPHSPFGVGPVVERPEVAEEAVDAGSLQDAPMTSRTRTNPDGPCRGVCLGRASSGSASGPHARARLDAAWPS